MFSAVRSCLSRLKVPSNHHVIDRVARNLVRMECSQKSYDELLISPDNDGFKCAADLIKSGGLVGFPTETVYGLGANALNEDAVKSIFAAKGRPLTDPLIVHVADFQTPYELIELISNETLIFKTLTELFWPGPLTLIVKASSKIPAAVTANTGFVGVRYPKHPIACRLIQESKLPIAAPSANRFGHVSPTRALHVLADLGEKGVHVINGEATGCDSAPCEYGIESTVAKIDGANSQITIFRQGAITQVQLENALRAMDSDWAVVAVQRAVNMHGKAGDIAEREVSESNNDESNDVAAADGNVGQEAPGQAITHYAPDVPCFIVQSLRIESDTHNADDAALLSVSRSEVSAHCVVIDYHGALSALAAHALAYRDLSCKGDAAEAAHSLFDTLRWAEQVVGAKKVLIAAISAALPAGEQRTNSEFDLTLGVADRVFRAASGQHVHLRVSQ